MADFDITGNAKLDTGDYTNGLNKIVNIGTTRAKVLARSWVANKIFDIGSAVVDAYANYEQLVGGVDTLFKDSSEAVQENAKKAFRTAGLSANEYMETVTSFSASLIQSVGGDTKKARKLADQAIIDMSDNANKMGTDIESIQNAYNGFSKQNYAMLDNLKLGYGGTKSEMERLLADAEAISGVKYDISNYADVVEAIHIIQENMGIAGTTAKEANETIQGSLSAMQSAWQNLILGFSDGSMDLETLLAEFIDTVTVFLYDNLLPRIGEIGTVMLENLPMIIETASTMIQGLLLYILENVPQFYELAKNTIKNIGLTLLQNLPVLVGYALSVIAQLLAEILTDLFNLGVNIVDGIWNGIRGAWDDLVAKLVDLCRSAWSAVKSFFGIHSPSTLMRDSIGKMIPRGMAIGIEADTSKVKTAMENMAKTGYEAVQLQSTKYKGAVNGIVKVDNDDKPDPRQPQNIINNFTFNQPVQTPDETARAIRLQQTYGLAGVY